MAWLAIMVAMAADLGQTPRYHVMDVPFTAGADAEVWVMWTHEDGATIGQYGFWDGGDRSIVRFCPPKTGTWTITQSTPGKQRLGDSVRCVGSEHAGYWIPDGRWFKRSDGSHPYITGNTHYSFLSRRGAGDGVIPGSAADDLRANAAHFKKVRFALTGDRYVDPALKPFIDEQGRPTDDGHFSHRPNPEWFRRRVDPAVRGGFEADVICDLIACGPDTPQSRSTLSNPGPWLRYVAARYGSYPNVWICLCNEWNIKQPRYEPAVMWSWGDALRTMQPRSAAVARLPVSTHGTSGRWPVELNNGDWNTHVIIQHKLKTIATAADAAARAWNDGGGKPVVNDENAYQGAGDNFSEEDTVAGCLGTFLGGGYPTTGEKHGKKDGQYFWGGFDVKAHTAADNIGFMRRFIDSRIEFWKTSPGKVDGVFTDVPAGSRLLAEPGRQYVLGTDKAATVTARLGEGKWTVRQADMMGMSERVIGEGVGGEFKFETPASRAGVTYFRRGE